MARRSRKRKLEGEDEDGVNWELNNILSEELSDEMATMWEIPQIFHFLQMSKKALNISHLSMYEMERMLAMPRASKQLAHIMTCLLSAPLPKGRMRKVPPMPYEFWVNVLTHKVKGWFKVYRGKHQDVVKVLETIGVEPEFWRIFPDSSIVDEKDFDQLNFKERVWILKTLCDTLMHSRKTIQDEMSKQFTDDQFTTVLGTDRYGAKYFYFPLFLDNDLRVYRHCVDNTILSTVKPPPRKEGQTPLPRPDKHGRNKRKRSRWKNGSLPVRSAASRRKARKTPEDEVKLSGDSAIGSLISEDTNMSGISACSNNNNTAVGTIDRNCSRSSSKTPESSALVGNPKSSGYDTNTSSDAKSVCGAEADEIFAGFDRPRADSENSVDAICTIRDIIDGLTARVSELVKNEESSSAEFVDRTKEKINEEEAENEEDEEKENEIENSGEKMSDSDREIPDDASGSDDLDWSKCGPRKSRTLDKNALQREIEIFASMLGDLSVSSFELVADSVESLRDLAISLFSNELNETRTRSGSVPRCEILLARSMEELVESLKDAEPMLKESARKARTKLRREWTQFKDGVVEDQDASGDVDRGSNRWILGSQGCPLLSPGDATLQALSEPALSPPSPESPARRRSPSPESDGQDPDDRAAASPAAESAEDGATSEKRKSERRVKIKVEKDGGDGENDDDENSKEEPATRRVLRRRGISSYTEQLSSSEEEAYELEEWSRLKTLNEAPSTSDGPPAVHAAPKTGQTGDESEEKDSDQDWLLPGARKRKNKRSPSNRRLKQSPQKPQTNNSDSQDSPSTNPPASSLLAASSLPSADSRSHKPAKDSRNTEVPVICKVESVHSELDIKDEGPIFDYNGSVAHPPPPISLDNNQPHQPPPSHQYHAVPLQFPTRPRQPLQPHADGGYFVPNPENYFVPGAVPNYVQYSFPHLSGSGGTARYPYPPRPQLPPYPGPPGQQNYWQYQKYGQMPPRPLPPNMLRPGYPTIQRGVHPQRGSGVAASQRGGGGAPIQRHQVASTTLYGARSPTKPSAPRMPGPRPIVVQNANFRGAARPRMATRGRGYGPRNPSILTPGTRMPRPNPRPVSNNCQDAPGGGATKTTSLILLSDSDDEIEMIVPEKQNSSTTTTTTTAAQNRQMVGKGKIVTPGVKPRAKPVVTSEITVPKSREMLSPQMIQRMSQGGISITPVKPPATKQLPGDAAQGTKLVVVVNETGSHYALALPNGSKLILTPEQVAQIRASNGGKLVL